MLLSKLLKVISPSKLESFAPRVTPSAPVTIRVIHITYDTLSKVHFLIIQLESKLGVIIS